MVIHNAKVYTVDPRIQFAEAVAIEGHYIKAVGTNKDINNLITPSTTVINANGRLILPGFNDAHLHFLGGGMALMQADLTGCMTKMELQNRLSIIIKERQPGEWITGRGWDHTLFNSGKWPTKEILDKVAPANPVFLRRIDGHIGWANSMALKIAGINSHTPQPEEGEIVVDHNGEPTGILKEAAMNLIEPFIPEPSAKDLMHAIKLALQQAARFGITSIQDNSQFESFELYHTLYQAGELNIRASEWLDLQDASNIRKLMEKVNRAKSFEIEDHLHVGLLKGFVDGTLGSRTALFFAPYLDRPDTYGIPQMDQSELNKMIKVADSLGLQVGVHCIGDKSNWMALQAFKNLEAASRKKLRHRIEHAQVIRPEDIPLFSELGVVASMQPTHCTSDLRWAEQRIGKHRCLGAYAWKQLLESGAKLAFGTDWPVEPLDPMRGIYSAVTRKNIETGEPEGGWFSDQCLTIEEAIYCYTMGSAYAEHQEDRKGSISPGKLADLVLLSKNILSISPEDILDTKVDMTIFDGKVVYSRDIRQGN